MYKNYDLYYCSFPNGGTEGLIDLDGNSESPQCGSLYEISGCLGDQLFKAMALITDVLQQDNPRADSNTKQDNYRASSYIINEERLSRELHQLKAGDALLGTFLEERFTQIRADQTTTDGLLMKEADDFINKELVGRPHCTMKQFQKFCFDRYLPIKGAEIVQDSLEDISIARYFADETLETILDLYQVPEKDREEVRDQFRPYMDNADEFRPRLKNWLILNDPKYDPEEEPTIIFHFYKIDCLFDLLSATMQEIIYTKKSIVRCAHCNRLFTVNKRSDEKYCSQSCREAEKEKQKKLRKIEQEVTQQYKAQYDMIRGILYVDDEIRGGFLREWKCHKNRLVEKRAIEAGIIPQGTSISGNEEPFETWVQKQVEWAKAIKNGQKL